MKNKLISASVMFAITAAVLLPVAGAGAAAVIDLGQTAAAADTAGVPAVETRFNETGKFLALMPVKLTVTVRVTPEGGVELGYPWYSKLTLDRQDKLATELKVAADNALRQLSVGKVTAGGEARKESFSPEEAAAVAAAVNRVLEENFGTEEAQ